MRSLHSLSCAKYRVLHKEPAGKTISKNDRFKINLDFTDKARRIKVPPAPRRRTAIIYFFISCLLIIIIIGH